VNASAGFATHLDVRTLPSESRTSSSRRAEPPHVDSTRDRHRPTVPSRAPCRGPYSGEECPVEPAISRDRPVVGHTPATSIADRCSAGSWPTATGSGDPRPPAGWAVYKVEHTRIGKLRHEALTGELSQNPTEGARKTRMSEPTCSHALWTTACALHHQQSSTHTPSITRARGLHRLQLQSPKHRQSRFSALRGYETW